MIDFVKKLAIDASKEFFKTKKTIIGQKGGGGNWVSKTDVALEKYLINKIKTKYPKDFIFAEETTSSLLPNSNRIWIIDPLDGTTNAVEGINHCAISIAFMKENEILIGVVYDIFEKKLYWAEKGKGAFVNGKRIKVSNKGLNDSIVFIGSPYLHSDFLETEKYRVKVHKAGARIETLGSAVVEGVLIAQGSASLFFETALKPWDVSAIKLIIEEAGGVVRGFDSELDVFNFYEFICGSKKAVKEFLSLLTLSNPKLTP